MASISNISESFCDWRSYVKAGDSIQAYDGRGWFAATIYKISGKNNQQLHVAYDNYSSQYDFHCVRQSKRIRPTIGFLRRKIMVPQSEKIKELENDKKSLTEENESLRQELEKLKQKWDTKNYQYLAVKRLSSRNIDETEIEFENEEPNQEEIENILMQNVKILSKWNKITKELGALNDELNEKNKELEIKDLVRIQVMMEKRIEIQRERLESQTNEVLEPIMNQKFNIDAKINKYKETLQNKKSYHSDKLEKYESIYKECEKLLLSLNDLVKYCNIKIKQENEMNKGQMNIEKELYKLSYSLTQFEEYGSSFFDLLKGFQKFQCLNKIYISNSTKKLNAGWEHIESSWIEWQSDDLLLWIQHKMGWLNIQNVPKYLDFDDILENMQSMQINGASLVNLKKTDLSNLGFKIYVHRTKIYQLIQSLMTKYKQQQQPDNNDAVDIDDADDESSDDSNNTDFEEEGRTTLDKEEMSVTVTIPNKYKCELTKELMTNPVICGHNNKVFEKTAIFEYIEENGELPPPESEFDDSKNEASINQINVNDISSYLLFDDLSLKIEIEQFKEMHDL